MAHQYSSTVFGAASMLSQEALLAWFCRMGLSDPAQAVITNVRSSQPARLVGSGRQSVSGRYPSRKMGVTIQSESHRVELAFLHELEHDPDVLEYYDQPPSFRLEYRSACGRRVVVSHTADYFVIGKNGAEWHECKTEEELDELAQRQPNRYCRRTDGGWCCPPPCCCCCSCACDCSCGCGGCCCGRLLQEE